MNHKLGDITDYLETIAPLRFQEAYDNSGLLVGEKSSSIHGAILSLDCTVSVVDEAIEKNCNLIISHHPLIFNGIKRFNSRSFVEKTLIKAIKNDIAIYAIHTNLDNVLHNGVNEKIAQKLNLQNISPIKNHSSDALETDYILGSGIIGHLRLEVDEKSFLTQLKSVMNCGVIKHTALLDQLVKRVAVCGGAGRFLLDDAIESGAQVFVTSDFKYHDFFEANDKIVVADIGHYESEFYTIELLFELLRKKFPNFAAHCTKVTTNPVRYF